MPKIVPIVEGEGEVEAVPKLIHKLLKNTQRWDIGVARPKNSNGCGNLIAPGGLERFLDLAFREPDCGAVLVLIDADKRSYCDMAADFAARAVDRGIRFPVVIVVANREYEAWFLASLDSISGRSIDGRSGLPAGLSYRGDVEAIVGVKGWLSRQMPEGRVYKETLDQAPLTGMIDIDLAKAGSRSFRRMCHAVTQAVEAIDSGSIFVSPPARRPK